MKKIDNYMFDVDGVLADFVWGFTHLMNQMGMPITPYNTFQQKSWDFQFPKEMSTPAWKAVADSEDFWESLPTLASADEMAAIAELNERENVYFVTSRAGKGSSKHQTESWLRARGILNPTVVITPHKGWFAHAINAHYSIDDKAGNATFVAYHARELQRPTLSFLLNQQYNQWDQSVLGTKVVRVATVAEMLALAEADSLRRSQEAK